MSKAQIARINGAKSIGPITAEGKAASAANSLKHGLTASRVVLRHESQAEFDALVACLTETFKPSGAFEQELVQEMAASRWRLRRIETMETAVFEHAISKHLEAGRDPAEAQNLAFVEMADCKSLRAISRHQGQLRRAYEKAWNELQVLQSARKVEAQQNEPSVSGLPVTSAASVLSDEAAFERLMDSGQAMSVLRNLTARASGETSLECL